MEHARYHEPVLLEEALELLSVRPGGRYCDGTVGGGGHAAAILERSAPDGFLLGVDRDPEAVSHCAAALQRFESRLVLRRGNFAEIPALLEELGWLPLDGILLDLGVSSHQLETAARGFSFARSGPLDMRMGPDAPWDAATTIARLDERALADVIYRYGEERRSRRIARAIKLASRAGRLRDTRDLAEVVRRAVGGRRRAVDPATRTFQALRIAVNDELDALQRFFDIALDAVPPRGRLVLISFHSLEDRAVKLWLRGLSRAAPPKVSLLTKKPIRPSAAETARNPRSRSARLRAAERC